MKIKNKNLQENEVTDKVTTVSMGNWELGIVEITHSQSVRQSLNYNSAECSYGIKLRCPNDPNAIKAAIKKAEALVEKPMSEKFFAQRSLLKGMTS